MAVVVQKFGGSSVADLDRIRSVAARVVASRREGHDVVVVVSAMGKTTDGLLALARGAAQDPATGAPGDAPRRELDMLVSTGERVTMALLSIAVQALGQDAVSFTGSQSGILTTERHFDARIVEVRPARIETELARGRVVIVAGYQGMSRAREITTLGRGGSDTTAVALAAALGAARCEIYSDVDGVYSADPRVVPEARHLPELDVDLLSEMAESGAKVLNAQAVEWARRSGVVLHARRTSDAPGEGRETVAARGASRSARAVVGLGDVALLEAFGAGSSEPAGARLVEVAAELELPLLDVAADGARGRACVPLANVPDFAAREAALLARLEGRATVTRGRGLVSLVGDGLTGPGGALADVPRVLARAGVRVHHLAAGPLRVGAVVDEAALGDAQRALHAAFVDA